MKANLWAMVTASVFTVGAVVLGTGCGKSDTQMAGDTARTFMGALANDDKTLARTQMTKIAREKMDETASDANHKSGLGKDGYTVGEATIDGDSASVPVTVTQRNDEPRGEGRGENTEAAPSVIEVAPTSKPENGNNGGSENDGGTRTETVVLKLRREDGEWKVWAMRVPLVPGGPSITMDFEHPEAVIGEAFKGLGEGLGAAMKGFGEGMGAMFQGMAKGMTEGAKAAGEGAKAAGEIAEKSTASTEHGAEKHTDK